MADLRILNLTAVAGSEPGSALVTWDLDGDVPAKAQTRVARDGTDTGGTGAWRTFIKPTTKRFTFTRLKDQAYTFTVAVKSGRKTLAQAEVTFTIGTKPEPTPAPQPTPTPEPTPEPEPTPSEPTKPNPELDPDGQYPKPEVRAVVSNVRSEYVGPGRVRISWDITDTTGHVTVGRDGRDNTGYGAWSATVPASTKNYEFTQLAGEYTFTVDPDNGDAVTLKVTVPVAPVVVPPPPGPAPAPPGPGNGTFKAMTMGAAVYYAADGGFNAAFGKRHGLYSTWGADGKVWAIDQPSSEYGALSVARLGDYDLDVAPQRKLSAGWSGAASGRDDKTWAGDIRELKSKWGDRRGHVFYRPWHEFNGDWYQWSVRSRQDQEDFKKAFTRLHGIWDDVMQGDKRFHLEWSPNRDSKFGLDLSNAYPDGIPDCIGPDYYDFALRMGASAQAAEQEKVRTQNGNGPVGIVAYLNFAKAKGVPVLFPEWGVQFGDNTTFLQMVLPVFEQYRYTGTGDPAGKILGAAWHNLQGKSPDPNAGGDFYIIKGNSGYSGRPNSFRMLRDWVQKSTWLRTV